MHSGGCQNVVYAFPENSQSSYTSEHSQSCMWWKASEACSDLENLQSLKNDLWSNPWHMAQWMLINFAAARMSASGSGCDMMSVSGSGCDRMSASGSGCDRMSVSGSGCDRMSASGSDCDRMGAIGSELSEPLPKMWTSSWQPEWNCYYSLSFEEFASWHWLRIS